MTRTRHSAEKGFSLLELIVSTVIMLVVAGGAFGALNYYQKTYQRTEISADMHDNLRSATDLIIQEAGQAGSFNFGTTLGPRRLTHRGPFWSPPARGDFLSNTTRLFPHKKISLVARGG